MGDIIEVPQGVFQLALPLEVGQVAPGVGVGDADVDDAADSRLPGGLEHHPGLLHALLVGAAAVVHLDPVGVEQGVSAPEGLGELIGLVEVEGVEGRATLSPKGFSRWGCPVMDWTRCPCWRSSWVMYLPV